MRSCIFSLVYSLSPTRPSQRVGYLYLMMSGLFKFLCLAVSIFCCYITNHIYDLKQVIFISQLSQVRDLGTGYLGFTLGVSPVYNQDIRQTENSSRFNQGKNPSSFGLLTELIFLRLKVCLVESYYFLKASLVSHKLSRVPYHVVLYTNKVQHVWLFLFFLNKKEDRSPLFF